MLFPEIYNKKVVNVYKVNWGDLGERDTKNYYIQGFCTVYSNGYKTVMGGGSCSSQDFQEAYLLNKENEIVRREEME